MDRLSAYLIVKRQLRQRESRREARRAEAIMEAFASRVGADQEAWAVVGLLSAIDLEYAASNPRARFVVASEQAALEGLEAWLCAALRRQARGEEAKRVQSALDLTWALLQRIDPRREEPLSAKALAQELELARAYGDAESERLDEGIEQLGGDLIGWTEAAMGALEQLGEERP